MSRAALVPDVRRIAVVRANAIGDFIATLPALSALRAAYPGAQIVLIGDRWHREFLEGRPGPVDRVLVAPPVEGVRAARPGEDDASSQAEAFFARTRAEGLDVAVQLHGGGRYSNPFTRRLGARLTVGLQAWDAPPLDRVVPYVRHQHEVLRMLEVVALVGAAPGSIDPVVTVTERDRAAAERVVPAGGPPIAVVHPGAMDPRRRWPPARFAEIARRLVRDGFDVVVTGAASEAPIAAEVARRAGAGVRDIAGALSLAGLTGLLARAAIVVANDTGPRHLAAALGTPTVGLYWIGNLINAGPVSRARHRTAVSWLTHCPVCGADCTADDAPGRTASARCPHDPSFLEPIGVEEVWRHARDLLHGWDAGQAAAA